MPDGIHCGPFNVSGSVGLHVRSGINPTPSADVRLGQVYTQPDGHLGYKHPSGTDYTLTPPGGGGGGAGGTPGLWDADTDNGFGIRPVNKSEAVHLASGSAALPSMSFIADPTKGFYHAAADRMGISLDGAQVAEFGRAGGQDYFQAPNGVDGQQGMAFFGNVAAGFNYTPAGPSPSEGLMTAGINVALQRWSGTLIEFLTPTSDFQGNVKVTNNGNVDVQQGSLFVSGIARIKSNAFFENDVQIDGNLDPKSVRYVPQPSNPASQNQDEYLYSRILDGNRLYHGTSGVAYLHEASSGVVIKEDGSVVGTFNAINFSGANVNVSDQSGEAQVVISGGGGTGLPSDPATDIADISSVPQWFKFVVDESDFTAATFVETIAFVTLPVKAWIHAIAWEITEDFSYGGLTGNALAWDVSIGDVDQVDKWLRQAPVLDVTAGGAETAYQPNDYLDLGHYMPDHANTHELRIRMTEGNRNSNVTELDAGKVTIWVLLSSMNAGVA